MTLNLFNVLKLHNNEGDHISNDGPHRSGKVVQRPTTEARGSSCAATGSASHATEALTAPQRQSATTDSSIPTDLKQRYARRRSSTNEKESETYFWIMWRW